MPAMDFIGPSYQLRSVQEDGQKTINLYPDLDETGKGKAQVFLTNTPGLKPFLTLENVSTTNPVRGVHIDSKENFYLVSGNAFIQVTYDAQNDLYNQVILGTMSSSSGPVSMSDNGFQVCVVDGPSLYIYVYSTGTFSQYNPAGWLGSKTVSYLQSYFIFTEPDTQKFYISGNYDGTLIDPLNFALKEGLPDNLVGSLAINQYLWLFGKRSIEIYYNSGNADFPFQAMQGGLINYGCIAPFSIAIAQNNPVWLGRDNNGSGTVYMADNSFQPKRISNFAVEYFMQNLETIEDAVAYSYQQEGHYFYVINFPTGKTTWVYDITTNMWHERQFFNTNTGQAERHRGQYHVFWNNKHLITDYALNKIYELSLDFYSDDGNPIQRIRRSPHTFGSDLQRVFFSSFQLDLDVGSFYSLDYTNEAKIRLRYSNNGGITWSDYLEQGLGKPGNYKKRVIWRKLGFSRSRVWEVSISDPVKSVLLNAYVETQTEGMQ